MEVKKTKQVIERTVIELNDEDVNCAIKKYVSDSTGLAMTNMALEIAIRHDTLHGACITVKKVEVENG